MKKNRRPKSDAGESQGHACMNKRRDRASVVEQQCRDHVASHVAAN